MSLSFSPDQVASWPIGRLLPYARNARTMAAVHAIAAALAGG